MDDEEIHQVMPSAPPLEKALPGPVSVPDQLIETPSAPPLDQSGAIELSEGYLDLHKTDLHDTIVKIPLNDLRSELINARALWRQANPGISNETDYPRFLQKKYYQHSNYNKNTSKKFQPTQYQIHTKSVDESFEEIE